MKHHYWEAPIVIYLFLGGLGGGIFFLSALFDLIIAPGSGPLFFAPVFFALAALALGCFFLVFELGQPPVFWRVFTTKTAIIKWGAVLLSVAMIFGFVWWASYLYVLGWEWAFGLAAALEGVRPIMLGVAGVAGFGVMVYTGVMLSTLKAHAFWATRRCRCCSPSRHSPRPARPLRCRSAGRFSLRAWPFCSLSSFTRSCIRSTSCSLWPRSSCCS